MRREHREQFADLDLRNQRLPSVGASLPVAVPAMWRRSDRAVDTLAWLNQVCFHTLQRLERLEQLSDSAAEIVGGES